MVMLENLASWPQFYLIVVSLFVDLVIGKMVLTKGKCKIVNL